MSLTCFARTFRSQALLLLVALVVPHPAAALSFEPTTGTITTSFPKGSSTLAASTKLELARRLPHIASINLEIMLVILWHVPATSPKAAEKVKNLHAARAQAIRQFFVDAGVPLERIHVEPKSISLPTMRTLDGNVATDGMIEIEYIGRCKPGYQNICQGSQEKALGSISTQ